MNNNLGDLLGPLLGHVIPGGCDDCNAEQTIQQNIDHPGLWHLQVAHDDTCPTYRAMQQAAQRDQPPCS